MTELTKSEMEGIRLVADIFVVEDLIKNVFAKEECTKAHVDGLRKAINKACPKFESAKAELQKQIDEVRKVWIEELMKDEE